MPSLFEDPIVRTLVAALVRKLGNSVTVTQEDLDEVRGSFLETMPDIKEGEASVTFILSPLVNFRLTAAPPSPIIRPCFTNWSAVMQPAFMEASFLEFRRTFKRDFYAWLYGNHVAEQVNNDMYFAYMAGGPL